ncbi:MAG: TonB-dependent receptor [Pseudohaliea sp.]
MPHGRPRLCRAAPLAPHAALLPLLAATSSAIAASDATAGARLEEVVVTANRRDQSLQDVSGAVSVLSGEELALRGYDRLEDYVDSQPGITLFQPLQNRATITTRGINTDIGDTQLTQEPTALYVDEMHVMPPYAALVMPDLRMYDIERVEVLRGPQGTLYGSGSLAGAVRVITRKPDAGRFAASFRADAADVAHAGLRQRYSGMVNVPLVDERLALRAVAYLRDEPGWVRNIGTGARNSNDDRGGRLALRWRPAERWLIDAMVMHQDSEPEDADAWDAALGKFIRDTDINEGRQAELTQGSLRIAWDTGSGDLVSATNFQRTKTGWVVQGPDSGPLGSLVNRSTPASSDILSQELRLVDRRGRWTWTAGAFAQTVDYDLLFDLGFTNLQGFVNGIVPGLLDGNSLLREVSKTESDEQALFADGTYALSDSWSLTAGIRAFRTESSFQAVDRFLFDLDTLTPLALPPIDNRTTDDAVSWRLVAAWQPDERRHLYLNIARGYRVGQVNPSFGPSPVDPDDVVIPTGYDHDKTINYEVGFRTRWLDERLVVNGALYYIDWRDVQVDALRPSDRINFIANAGDAVSQGLELELALAVTARLNVSANIAFQDAEIESQTARQAFLSGALEGDTLPGTADVLAAAALDYRRPLPGGRELSARLDLRYRSDSPNRFSNAPGTGLANPSLAKNADYLAVNGSLGLASGPWRATLYVENLTDNDDVILDTGAVATGNARNTQVTLTPRTVGLRLDYRF